MSHSQITDLETLLSPAVEALGYNLWGLVCVMQDKKTVLRVFIDHPRGINVDDCAQVSYQISGVLAVNDPLKGDYILEVSSPGLDRLLFKEEHYKQFKGQKIKLRLKKPYENQRNFQGIIQNAKEGKLTLNAENQLYVFSIEEIERANIMPDFGDKGLRQ